MIPVLNLFGEVLIRRLHMGQESLVIYPKSSGITTISGTIARGSKVHFA